MQKSEEDKWYDDLGKLKKPSNFKVKNLGGFNINYHLGNKLIYRMEVLQLDFSLNLKLPLIVLTHVTTCSFESIDSFIWICHNKHPCL